MDPAAERRRLPDWALRILIGRSPKRTGLRVLVLIATSFIVFKFVLLPIQVQGIIMLPTYRDHGINLVNRLAYVRSMPRRGDVVSIELAGKSMMYMKRIIGLPGETLSFHLGHAFI